MQKRTTGKGLFVQKKTVCAEKNCFCRKDLFVQKALFVLKILFVRKMTIGVERAAFVISGRFSKKDWIYKMDC